MKSLTTPWSYHISLSFLLYDHSKSNGKPCVETVHIIYTYVHIMYDISTSEELTCFRKMLTFIFPLVYIGEKNVLLLHRIPAMSLFVLKIVLCIVALYRNNTVSLGFRLTDPTDMCIQLKLFHTGHISVAYPKKWHFFRVRC